MKTHPRSTPAPPEPTPATPGAADAFRAAFLAHLRSGRGKTPEAATAYDRLAALSLAVRDLAMDRLLATEATYRARDPKRAAYLSMEFLLGRLLWNNLVSLGAQDVAAGALAGTGLSLEEVCGTEVDAGLGNGGLGRLAACFLDSLATLEYPASGHGIRYEHGMFRQEFDGGWQFERPDDWLRFGNPWEIVRPEDTVPVLVYGRIESLPTAGGGNRPVWVDWQIIEGVPHDVPVVGYGVGTVNVLRLWSSRAAEGFRLDVFNQGDYVRAVEEKNWAETVSKVLYPSENTHAGRGLRLLQEYFLVACAVRDIVRGHLAAHGNLDRFAGKNAVQLNDTHPALAVAELMRHFVDEHDLPWERAWDLTVATCGYTNHTLLPEALERWPVPLFERVLPRHLQIIYDINHRFLGEAMALYPGDTDRIRRLSLIEEGPVKQVRMANLAIVGSHAVNGVARLHTELLQAQVVPDFAAMFPARFSNKTNGVTQRRWLLACNPGLATLITEAVGPGWVRDLGHLRGLEPLAADRGFLDRFAAVKAANKERLARLIRERLGGTPDPASLFDVQVKRLHEYKRQLLNALHIIALYHRIKDNPGGTFQARTFIFGAKAAPGYHIAKRIIKLINNLGEVINRDPDVQGRLQVYFLPDYSVSLAEIIIPAANLSEQISTAGKEASGTGNMKLALNGALTIGTWDGANIEIAEAVGLDNIFICGHRAEALETLRRENRYQPFEWLERDAELKRTVLALREGAFNLGVPGLFDDLYRVLTEWGDTYFHLADFPSYSQAQQNAAALFGDTTDWNRRAVLNVARMGPFSSDRAIREYAREIWGLESVAVKLDGKGVSQPPSHASKSQKTR
jgi:starch phosphorylase